MSRYKRLYRDRSVEAWLLGCVATRPTIRQQRAATRSTSARVHAATCRGLLRHDREGATKQSRVRHDTAQRAPRHGAERAAWVQCALPGRSARGLGTQAGSGCAPGAPNLVFTQCTVFSHCLNNCSQDFSKK